MKRFYLLISLIALVSIGFGQTTYSEDFDTQANWAGGSMGSYNAKTYTNDALDPASDQFSSDNAVRESSNVYSGAYAWRLKKASGVYFRYECEETVSAFHVYMARWDNSPTPHIEVKYSTNSGSSYTTIETIDGGTFFTGDKVYKLYSYTFSSPIAPDGSGDKVYIEFVTTSGERMLYDDFELTYSSGGSSGPDNPSNLLATTVSTSEIDLSWSQNAAGDNVMVAWSADGTFGTPTDGTSYTAGNTITGGGTVLYNGNNTTFNHTALSSSTQYYYKAFSVDGSTHYSTGITDDATTFKDEPTNHVSGFTTGDVGATSIQLTWSDNDGTVAAENFLIMINTTGTFAAPVDGVPQTDDTDVSDGSGQVNVAHGVEAYRWTNLSENTQYYFTVYPHTNAGTAINYKTDGTVPTVNGTTTVVFGAPDLFISEYIEGSGNNKALEIFNGTGSAVDLSNYQIWKISNGGSWPESTLSLSGTLSNGNVYVIYYSGADAAIVAVGDVTWTQANWNGDDAVGIAKNDGTGTFALIDAVGEDGSDPGSGWNVAGVTNATKDHTLVRKSSVLSPNTNWSSSAGTTTANSEWVVYNSNELTHIGSHVTNAPPIPVSDYAIVLLILLAVVFVGVKSKIV